VLRARRRGRGGAGRGAAGRLRGDEGGAARAGEVVVGDGVGEGEGVRDAGDEVRRLGERARAPRVELGTVGGGGAAGLGLERAGAAGGLAREAVVLHALSDALLRHVEALGLLERGPDALDAVVGVLALEVPARAGSPRRCRIRGAVAACAVRKRRGARRLEVGRYSAARLGDEGDDAGCTLVSRGWRGDVCVLDGGEEILCRNLNSTLSLAIRVTSFAFCTIRGACGCKPIVLHALLYALLGYFHAFFKCQPYPFHPVIGMFSLYLPAGGWYKFIRTCTATRETFPYLIDSRSSSFVTLLRAVDGVPSAICFARGFLNSFFGLNSIYTGVKQQKYFEQACTNPSVK
jgi:hypothetical protein